MSRSQTAAASTAVNGPAKTETSPRARCRDLSRRPYDHAIAAPSEPCRGEVRGPVDSRSKRWSSPAATSPRSSVFIRAAASSMASGRPSSRRTISSTTASSSGPGSNPGATALARSTNSCTAGASSPVEPAVARVGTVRSCSPGTRRRSRLVVTIRTCGHRASSCSTSPATGSRTCSQLSSEQDQLGAAEHVGDPLCQPDPGAAVDRQGGGDGVDGRLSAGRSQLAQDDGPVGPRRAQRADRPRRACGSCPPRRGRSA